MKINLPARVIWHSVEVVLMLLFYHVCRLFLEEWRSITGVSILLATRCDRLNRSDPIIIAIITEEYLCVCVSLSVSFLSLTLTSTKSHFYCAFLLLIMPQNTKKLVQRSFTESAGLRRQSIWRRIKPKLCD